MYDKLMYKVPSRNNKVIYRLQDFTKNDNVDESMFIEAENSKGAKRLQCEVKVLHENEFKAIIEELEQAKHKVESLNNTLMQKNVEIKRLETEIKENKREHESQMLQVNDKLNTETRSLEKKHQNDLEQLKETHANQLLAIDETHREHLEKMRSQYTSKLDDVNKDLLNEVKENDKARDILRGEMLDLKENHKQEVIALQSEHHRELETIQHKHANELQDLREQNTYDIDQLKQAIATIKQEHLIEVNEIEQKQHHEVEQIRSYFLKVVTLDYTEDISELEEIEKSVPSLLKPFMKKHVKHVEDMKKRKLTKTPEKNIKTYELAGEKEKEQ